MIKGKLKSIIGLDAASAKEMEANLTEMLRKGGARPRAVVVSISEPKVMICPFQLERDAMKDVEHHLLSEAVEIMSLTPDEIVLDFQVTSADPKMVKGIYMCIPKDLLEQYLNVLDKKFLNPLKITEQFLVNIDRLFQLGKLSGQRICFLDFSAPPTVSLFISSKGECELLRKIRYEDYEEAQREIIQSLRSAIARNSVKHYDHVYYLGGFAQMAGLAASLREIFRTETEGFEAIDRKAALTDGREYFSLNLAKRYNFSPHQMRRIHAVANGALALCLMNVAFWGLQLSKKNGEISRVKAYYQDAEYQYAVKLRDNIRK